MSRAKYISYQSTGSFSQLVIDYINQDEKLKDFITDFPSIESIKRQIENRNRKLVDRDILAEVLTEQYQQNDINLDHSKVGRSIAKLHNEKTFTICTAHQPNIFTGYLYTIYKIIHAINLAKLCEEQIEGYQFVPVFFIGSEDNDIEEIGGFNFNGKKYQWQPDEHGACGRFSTSSLLEIRDEILSKFGNSEAEVALKAQILLAYDGKRSLTQATQHFIHSLFEAQGLVALDADNKGLKEAFKPIIQEELEKQSSHKIVIEHNKVLAQNYKIQVEPRELNLFYLKDNLRERIEKEGPKWTVVNNDFKLHDLSLVDTNPEFFSPNVILRPLYQEIILPNVAFIGGGSEIAYWAELKPLFNYHNVPFPILLVRNSVSIVSDKIMRKMEKMGIEESFKTLEDVLKQKSKTDPVYNDLVADLTRIETDYQKAFGKAQDISPSLDVSARAQLAKIIRIHERIKGKYRAHLKRQYEDIENLKLDVLDELFPSEHLQERYENYIEIVVRFKVDVIKQLLNTQQALEDNYLILSVE